MNEVLKAIFERRSIRKYKSDPISDADRDNIVKAGLFAPSSKNTQPWRVTIVQNAETISAITREVKAAIRRAGIEKYAALAENPKYTVNFTTAPMFVIVSANPSASTCPAEDCSVLLENMFLAAHSLGIGSCWVNQLGCVSDEPGFRRFITELGVPESNRIYGSACFGYAAVEHPAPPPRKEDTVNIIS